MDTDNKAILSGLEEVKRHLDPVFSYMVFEQELGSSEGKDLSEVMEALSRLRKRELGFQLYRDENRGIDFLVVKMEPDQDELIMETIIDIGVSEDFTCYLYRSRIKVRS